MNERAVIGGNNPPDPIEEVLAFHDGTITEAQNWADGDPVTNEEAMQTVDLLLKDFKAYRSDLTKAAKERTDPLHKAWKAEVAAVKVYTDDADRLQKALVAVVAPFKERLAAEKRAAERKAWEDAEKARKEAEAKAAAANAASIEEQREAEDARRAAMEAEKAAQAARKDSVKGMRAVTNYEVTDHKALLHWIAQNAREDLTAFIDEWARRNHKPDPQADGLKVWTTKEAF